MERTLGEHLDVMVKVFREVRRVLKHHGTVWLNYGDCFATTPNGRAAADVVGDDRTFRDKPFSTIGPIYQPGHNSARGQFSSGDRQARIEGGGRVVAGGTLKNKDLCMVANRLGLDAILIELNPEYAAMAEARIAADRNKRSAAA